MRSARSPALLVLVALAACQEPLAPDGRAKLSPTQATKSWTIPDENYVISTTKIPIDSLVYNTTPELGFTTTPGLVGCCGQTISDTALSIWMDAYAEPINPGEPTYYLSTWGAPPYTESSNPRLLYVYSGVGDNQTVSLKLSRPVKLLGFELQPVYTYPTPFVIRYYANSAPISSVQKSTFARAAPQLISGATLIQTTNITIAGEGGAALVEFDSTASFDLVTITMLSPSGGDYIYGFGVAQPRYVLAPEDSLKLDCKQPQVTRGEIVTCTATRLDNQPVVASKWLFTSTDADLPGYSYVRDDGTLSAATWTGRMVASGKVRVESVIGGQTRFAEATVSVADRDWSAIKIKSDTIVDVTDSAAKFDPPPMIENFGGFLTRTPDADIGDSVLTKPDSGPNANVYYLLAPPYKLRFEVWWNDVALKVGSKLYSMQPDTRPAIGTSCAKADVAPKAEPLVKAHEGFKKTDINSHTEVFRRVFLANVRDSTENMLAPGGSFIRDPMGALVDSAFARAARESKRITDDKTVGGTNPFKPGCVFQGVGGQS
jgi:hypothetical protein